MLYWVAAVMRFVLGYAELSSVYLGILAWELSTKTKLTPEIKWSLYAGAFIGLSFWNWHKATTRVHAAETTPAEPRRAYAESPEVLLAHLGNPRPLIEAQVIRDIGKWITVSGKVEGTADSLVRDAIFLTLILERGRRVNLRFPMSARDELRDLKKGQFVTADCQFCAGLALENCRLLRRPSTLAKVS